MLHRRPVRLLPYTQRHMPLKKRGKLNHGSLASLTFCKGSGILATVHMTVKLTQYPKTAADSFTRKLLAALSSSAPSPPPPPPNATGHFTPKIASCFTKVFCAKDQSVTRNKSDKSHLLHV